LETRLDSNSIKTVTDELARNIRFHSRRITLRPVRKKIAIHKNVIQLQNRNLSDNVRLSHQSVKGGHRDLDFGSVFAFSIDQLDCLGFFCINFSRISKNQ
jgi:hypothetical protein